MGGAHGAVMGTCPMAREVRPGGKSESHNMHSEAKVKGHQCTHWLWNRRPQPLHPQWVVWVGAEGQWVSKRAAWVWVEGVKVNSLDLSPRAAITRYHSLGGLNNRRLFLTVLEAASVRSGYEQGWVLFLAYRRLPSCCVLS